MTPKPSAPESAPRPPANPARFLALIAMRKVDEGLTVTEALIEASAATQQGRRRYPIKDRALAQALVYETVRHKSYLDWLIDQFLERPGRKLKALLRSILRLGLAQILYFDRLPHHAVVMETVNLARAMAQGGETLVNGLLRSVLRALEADQLPQPEQDQRLTTSAQRLAVRHSHPLWLVERELAALSQAKAEARLAANNQAAPLTLRINPKRVTRAQLMDSFQALDLSPQPTPHSPWGINMYNYQGPLDGLPGFNQGLFSIQDEASQIAVMAAAAGLPKQALILDAGAGLGGKTTALAGLRPEATLVACDIDQRKLALIPPEIERLRLTSSPRLVAGDLTDPNLIGQLRAETNSSAGFDLVFLDAPCSGLGVIRRRPDIKWHKSPQDIHRLARKQLAMLTAAEKLVQPGGRLIYAVCTITNEETWGVVEAFLKQSRVRLKPPAVWSDSGLSHRGCLSLNPETNGTDGFFAASFTLD